MKKILRVVFWGVLTGLLLLFVKIRSGISEEHFWKFYVIGGIIVIAGALLFNILYTLHYQRRMRQLVQLFDEGRIQEYTETLERLCESVRGRFLKRYFRLNLSAGYCALKRFAEAEKILEELESAGLKGELEAVRRINLCECRFYMAKSERALELYKESLKYFAPCREDKRLGGSIAELDVLAAITRGDREEAEELLRRSMDIWKDVRFQENYVRLRNLLEEKATAEK